MAVDNKKLAKSRGGQTREESDAFDADVVYAGLWRHPASGEEAVTKDDPLYGNAMSQAFARMGFERVGDVPTGYVKDMGLPSVVYEKDPARKPEMDAETIKGLQARLNALEGAKDADKVTEDPMLQSEKVKQDAADNVARQNNVPTVDVSTGNVVDDPSAASEAGDSKEEAASDAGAPKKESKK